jgi:hypothetical protein
VQYDENSKSAYFCTICIDKKVEIKKLITNKDKEENLCHAVSQNNTASNNNMQLEVFSYFNIEEENATSTLSNSNNMRDSRGIEFDFNIESDKRQNEVRDATQQINELVNRGQTLHNAQRKLNKAIANLIELNKPRHVFTHTFEQSASPQLDMHFAPLHKQNKINGDLKTLLNDPFTCAVCCQKILRKENSLKCNCCSILFHTECGFNYGEVTIADNSSTILHCRRCINLKFFEQSKNINATERKNLKPKHNPQNIKEPWAYKCWVCQRDDHFIRDCKVSREKDGKEIFAFARKLKVCALCGKEKYVRGKVCTGQKTPSECRKCPGKLHWAIVCPLRKGSKSTE